jgi:serine/threonine protein kinase
MRGLYSMKSDVYSFGVLLLEILTGRGNCGSFDDENGEDLLSLVRFLIIYIYIFKITIINPTNLMIQKDEFS